MAAGGRGCGGQRPYDFSLSCKTIRDTLLRGNRGKGSGFLDPQNSPQGSRCCESGVQEENGKMYSRAGGGMIFTGKVLGKDKL